ncbi:hypothetical protein WIW50_19340 [Flavobacteriaceae bacterium 3-367]|uniref:hypothetical protein n=1 Tax=Eudoraea algarum TaxID=3417568 RepID=UPI00328E8A00
MKKGTLVLGVVLLFGFAPSERLDDNNGIDSSSNNAMIVEEIAELNQIIESKCEKAEMLEAQARIILQKDGGSEKGLNLVKVAKLQRMMTLKYKAAIACRIQFLE